MPTSFIRNLNPFSAPGIELKEANGQKGAFWLVSDTFFGPEGAEKVEPLKNFGKNWVKWHIFDAAGAEIFE